MGIRIILFFIFFICTIVFAETNKVSVVPPVIVKSKVPKPPLSTGPSRYISLQEISASGASSLAQTLQHLAGIQLQDAVGNGSRVSLGMRGFGSNATSNTLFLINGIPITNPDLAPPNLTVIPLREIAFIEVIEGTESVLYGDQAVAGIVNVMMPLKTQERLEVTCTLGSYQQYNCYAMLNDYFHQLKYNLSAAHNHMENYRDHNDYDQNFVLGRFDLPYQTGHLNFDFNIGNEDMQYPGALTAAQVRQDRQQANNDTDFFKDWNAFFHLQHQQYLNDDLRLSTDLALRVMHGHGILTAPFNQSRMIYFLKPQLKGCIYGAGVISGVELERDSYHLGSLFGLTEDTEQKYSVFGLLNVPATAQVNVSLGLRLAQLNSHLESYTVNDTINRAIATTVGMCYQWRHDLQWYLRRAESYRFPKADENAFVPAGVTSLRTQRGVSYETGIQWQGEQTSARIGLYQLNLRDEITFDPTQTPQQPFGANRNLAPTVRRGLTLSGRQEITPSLAFGGQYNYVNARFQTGLNAGHRIPLVSENILLANVDYRIYGCWNIYAEAIYTGNQFPANDDANISGIMGGYTIVNVNLRFQMRNIEASFRVNNVFNKQYYFYTVFRTSTHQDFFYPAPERNFLLTVKYVWL